MNLEKRQLGRTGLAVTFVGFGALEIGRNWGVGIDTKRPSEEEAGRVLNRVLDLGIDLIDTASAYHKSEERIGRFISHRRQEFVLTSKCGEHSREPDTYYDFSYRAIKESIDRSLRLLRTDVIDVMQIHFGPEPEKVLQEGETVAAMQDARKEGKIRFLGASPPNEILDACIDAGVFDVLQVGYNLLDRGAENAIARAAEAGIGILVRSGFAGGLLTPRVQELLENSEDRHLAEVKKFLTLLNNRVELLPALALQFLHRNPNISSVLVGTKSEEHLKANLRLLQMPLPEEAKAFLTEQ